MFVRYTYRFIYSSILTNRHQTITNCHQKINVATNNSETAVVANLIMTSYSQHSAQFAISKQQNTVPVVTAIDQPLVRYASRQLRMDMRLRCIID